MDKRTVPVLAPAATSDEALMRLAGAFMVGVELMMEDRGKEPSTAWSAIFILALAQWQRSGFLVQEAQAVADQIAEAYLKQTEG